MKKPWPTTEAPARDGSGGWPQGGLGAAWCIAYAKGYGVRCEEAPTQEGTPEPRCAKPAQGHHSGQPVGGQKAQNLNGRLYQHYDEVGKVQVEV